MVYMKLGDICSPKQWKTISTSELTSEGYPVYGANGIIGYYKEFNHIKETILVTCRGATCGSVNITRPYSYVNGNAMALDNLDERFDINYLYFYLSYRGFNDVISGSAQPQIIRSAIEKILIPLYPIEQQRKIASLFIKINNIHDLYRKENDRLDELIKSRFIEIFGDPENNNKAWKVKFLDNLCTVGSSKRIYQSEQSSEGIPFWRISDLVSKIDTGTVDSELFISKTKYAELEQAGLVPVTGDILLTSRGTLGKCYIIKDEDRFYFQDGMISWLGNYSEEITPIYLQYLFSMSGFRKQINRLQAGSTVAYLSIAMLKKLQVMVPDKTLQEQFAGFVAQIDKSKSAIQAALDKTQLLFDSLMQEYFG